METTTQELKKIFELLIDHVEQNCGNHIDVSDDYYWQIPEEMRYDVTIKPADFEIGQLSEDIENLRKMLNGERTPVSYGLVWFSKILARAGETLVP